MTIRVGLVGLGSMGKNHLRVIQENPAAELWAICDSDVISLRGISNKVKATSFSDPFDMISRSGVDALVVATPTEYHYPIVLEALKKGIPVLVEKPIATTYTMAQEIAKLSAIVEVPVQVGHVERYNPAVLHLAKLLAEGMLTDVYSITSIRSGPLPERVKDVGVTLDLGTHDVDIISWIAGERPSRVYAETTQKIHASHEDLAFGLLKFPSGKVGMVDVNWLTPVKRRSLRVVGRQGMFELDYLTQQLTFTSMPLGIEMPLVSDLTRKPEEPLAAQFSEFLEVVKGPIRPRVNAEDGAWAVRIAEALVQAAKTGVSVKLV